MKSLRIGTRGSPLALWQAHHVADRLRAAHPGIEVTLIEIQTVGDQVQNVPLASFGGEGVFTKAIQQALLADRVDVAVHSLKDLPTLAIPELTLGAVPPRGPTGDALLSVRHAGFDALPAGAVVGTSSLRRRAQLLHRRPDLTLVDLRGNVDTRIRKLADQGLDAIVLAEAGLKRLGLEAHLTEILDSRWMYPAVGQGALGIECRADDDATRAALAPLDEADTRSRVLAERSLLRTLQGGCHVPVGVRTCRDGDLLALVAAVIAPDGSRRIETERRGPASDPEALGRAAAEDLLSRGAATLLGK